MDLYFRWKSEHCTLEMLMDKKSDGFKLIEEKLANEVSLFSQSKRQMHAITFRSATQSPLIHGVSWVVFVIVAAVRGFVVVVVVVVVF